MKGYVVLHSVAVPGVSNKSHAQLKGRFPQCQEKQSVPVQHFPLGKMPVSPSVCIASALYFSRTALPTAHSPPGVIKSPRQQEKPNPLQPEKLKCDEARTMSSSSNWEAAAVTGDRNDERVFLPRF